MAEGQWQGWDVHVVCGGCSSLFPGSFVALRCLTRRPNSAVHRCSGSDVVWTLAGRTSMFLRG